MGKDGTAGVEKVREKKSRIIAQDRETSVIFGMPKSVIDKGYADVILPLDEIADGIAAQIRKLKEGAK
jgi:two-component system chemotaxis response regulator CheB